jgi:integrase
MKKENFTVGRIAGFKCEAGKDQSIYWDAKIPGLGLRVTANGAASYIFESRLHGKTLRITIGNAKAWVLGQAQTEAARLKTLVDQEIDPRQERADKHATAEAGRLEAKRQKVTLGDAWAAYIVERRFRWSELHYRDHIDLSSQGGQPKKRGKGITAPGPLAPLLALKLPELTGRRIAEWMQAEAAVRPARVRLAFNLLRIFAGWGESKEEYRGLIDQHALSTRIAKDTLPRRQPKNDALQREQLASWFQAIQEIKNPVMSAYLVGLLITGARREELAELKWEDVDFRWGSLTIRDKVDGRRIIPLPPYLASQLRNLQRLNDLAPNTRQLRRLQTREETWHPSPWVFFSLTSADGKLASPNAALHRACQIAGIPPVTVHGLRRSFGSLAEWTETPTGIVAQIMGHKPSATAERHYRVRPLDLLRSWHNKIEAWILEQAGIESVPAELGLRVVIGS